MQTSQSFGKANFSQADLGDKRRTKRLVSVADAMKRRPGGTLPQKFRCPKDLKAFYRLMDSEQVTHEAILMPHQNLTLEKIEATDGPVLILHDATEMDFTTHNAVADQLGQIGNGNRRGYIVQNSLAVDPKTRDVLGLCNQVLHHRVKVPKNESASAKRERKSRESLLWLQGTQPLPGNRKFVDVCDQGADTFEFLEHEAVSGRRFVIRSAWNRGILVGHNDSQPLVAGNLRSYARTLPIAGTWKLQVTSRVSLKSPRRKGKKKKVKRIAREANMAVSYAAVSVKPPGTKKGNHGDTPLKLWVVRVWEVDPPEGQERLEWFLLTNERVETFAAAYRVVGWYECRWIVEEYHKGMKTGCRIESPQFTRESRLQPAIALLSVVTLTLLQMRNCSRRPDAKTRKATTIISSDYVAMLSIWRHGKPRQDWTIHDFYYALARLGGHQNRKGDGPPGWQVIWEGWNELQPMITGFQAAQTYQQCG